jgi:hypothetical protein
MNSAGDPPPGAALPFPERRRPGADRRLAARDRRQGAFRGGRRASDLILAAALSAGGFAASAHAGESGKAREAGTAKLGRRATDVVSVTAVPAPAPRHGGTIVTLEPMRFGVDMASVGKTASEGLSVAYGAFWVGPWTQKYGWEETDRHLEDARKLHVVPVVNWWYWGDDISPKAVEEGVEDRYHHVRKDRASWTRMSRQLAGRIERAMGGREAIVVLETEFNKNGIEGHAPFDGYLAEQIRFFHSKPGIKVVLGFGNWGGQSWGRFSRSIADSDLLGIQLLQSSVRDAATYAKAPDALVSAARYIHTQFHKPSLIVDLALSSYGPRYEESQAAVMTELFRRLPELKVAGVKALIWRAVKDDPRFDTANYHGEAERHWGLLRADGSPKPAFAAFTAGVRAERSKSAAVGMLMPPAAQVARAGTP